jgi:hypothetical protein
VEPKCLGAYKDVAVGRSTALGGNVLGELKEHKDNLSSKVINEKKYHKKEVI